MLIKKNRFFGGGFAEVYNSIFWNNEVDLKSDDQSKIAVYYSNLKDLDGQNNNLNIEPVFNSDFTNNLENGNLLFINGGSVSILKDKLDIKLDQVSIGLNK